MAQEESRSISENVTWGKRKSAADGKVYLAFKNFLGYDQGPNGTLILNEQEAPIIRRIYREFMQGKNSLYDCYRINRKRNTYSCKKEKLGT